MREINEDSFYDIQHDDILNESWKGIKEVKKVEFYGKAEKHTGRK